MNTNYRKEAILLLFGDMLLLFLSLFLSVFFRNIKEFNLTTFFEHILPFSIIFIISILLFFISGLYEKHTRLFKLKLPKRIVSAQIVNTFISIAIFYFFPQFIIAPKIVLFLYLIISSISIFFWRAYIVIRFSPIRSERTIIFGSGNELRELAGEIKANSRYGLNLIAVFDLDLHVPKIEEIIDFVYQNKISIIIADYHDDKIKNLLPVFYGFIQKGIRSIDIHDFYEEVFDCIPVSLIDYRWFLDHISLQRKFWYDTTKRIIEILFSFTAGLLTLLLYPFVILLIKLESKGPIFSIQERVGLNGKQIKLFKFRTMTNSNDNGKWVPGENKVTKVGSFLRKTRIDEFPQFWNIIKGDISLIGPRPEFKRAVDEYSKSIPYYESRHIIKPGLCGWAQIYHENHPHHGLDIDETRKKLSYDLFYIKERSLLLDFVIILKTFRIFLTFVGK